MAPVFRKKCLDIVVTKRDDLIVGTDVAKLDIVLRNIISNAVKFTETGAFGLITVLSAIPFT
ncbi:MAG: hypothetical protein RMJ39_08320 [Deltaproteobacteria bacterium]|nr:hypothetical protein [Deltaproteobacteria bacterium]